MDIKKYLDGPWILDTIMTALVGGAAVYLVYLAWKRHQTVTDEKIIPFPWQSDQFLQA